MSVRRIEKDGFSQIELKNSHIDMIINPGRGNLITSLIVDQQEWMYLNHDNYKSKERPRCGCPVLFPYCGNNTDDLLYIKRTAYPSQLHGVVHTNTWAILTLDEEHDRVSMRTTSTQTSKKLFPFDFQLDATISIRDHTLWYEMSIINQSSDPMPCDLGFHPFFQISELTNIVISTTAKQGYDPIHKTIVTDDFLSLDRITTTGCVLLQQKELLVEDKQKGYRLVFGNEEGLCHFMVWSGNPKQFLVVEPLSGVPDAINDHMQAFTLQPGEQKICAWTLGIERIKA